MKASITFALALVATCFSICKAQTNPSPINIVPTATPGIIKVIYAAQPKSPVVITFSDDHGEIQKDKIKVENYPDGVSKRYDVSDISKKEFYIQVSSGGLTAKYHITPTNNNRTFVKRLEKTVIDNTVVATRD